MAEKPRDLFMNFKAMRVQFDAGDSSNLREAVIDTGMSIRGRIAWLIHQCELEMDEIPEGDNAVMFALSTRQDMAIMPRLTDDGVVALMGLSTVITTSGAWGIDRVQKSRYLPPLPLATSKLSLYAQSRVDGTNLKASWAWLRIGFTTIELDAKTYVEVAETWGW